MWAHRTRGKTGVGEANHCASPAWCPSGLMGRCGLHRLEGAGDLQAAEGAEAGK